MWVKLTPNTMEHNKTKWELLQFIIVLVFDKLEYWLILMANCMETNEGQLNPNAKQMINHPLPQN